MTRHDAPWLIALALGLVALFMLGQGCAGMLTTEQRDCGNICGDRGVLKFESTRHGPKCECGQ